MIYFTNPGLMPVEGFSVLGVNVKGNDNAIGHFGTGLKISIARILAWGGEILIKIGKETHQFGIEKGSVRDKEFNFVTWNGERLGFTTELGKNWEPWMVMRELESNCRDEGGSSGFGEPDKHDVEGTTVLVRCPLVEAEYSVLENYFITTEPISVIKGRMEFHRGATSRVYYRGILVSALPNPLPFTVNFTMSMQELLTEDRTIDSHRLQHRIGLYLCEGTDRDFYEQFLTEEVFNDYEMMGELTPSMGGSLEFLETLKSLDNKNPMILPEKWLNILYDSGMANRATRFTTVPMSEIERMMVDRGQEFVKELGFTNVRDFPVYKVDKLPLGVAALAYRGGIYLSEECFGHGTKYVCSTMLEEYLHLAKGLDDCSRGMQNTLFDLIATIMERYHYKTPL